MIKKNNNPEYNNKDKLDLSPKNNVSYVKGSSTPKLIDLTISQLLKKSVSQYGSRDVFLFFQN